MRISDWSSDVCSSDLGGHHVQAPADRHGAHEVGGEAGERHRNQRGDLVEALPQQREHRAAVGGPRVPAALREDRPHRSEEHTSELQSLMRISYAVFCLKKNTHALQQLTHIACAIYSIKKPE